MAKLYFRYAAMNSGKSLNLLAVAFNYEERGMRIVVAKPTVDTKSSRVVSRVGLDRDVDWHLDPETSIRDLFQQDRDEGEPLLACILIDEAQFLVPGQVDELFELAVLHDTPVMAFGLRGDFRTHAFPGSRRLLEVAHSIEEMKTICDCGKKAVFNARKINGKFVREGATVAIDQASDSIAYESLCGRCYYQKVGRPSS